MLVLSRKVDESIVINDDVTVTVVQIRGDKVRLGVEAPKELPVHRQEVYDTIQKEERERSNGKLPEWYQQFQGYLGSGEFFKAYQTYSAFSSDDRFPTREDLGKLVSGLGGSLQTP